MLLFLCKLRDLQFFRPSPNFGVMGTAGLLTQRKTLSGFANQKTYLSDDWVISSSDGMEDALNAPQWLLIPCCNAVKGFVIVF